MMNEYHTQIPTQSLYDSTVQDSEISLHVSPYESRIISPPNFLPSSHTFSLSFFVYKKSTHDIDVT